MTDEAVPATCTEDGLTEGSHCSVCEEVIKAQEVVPATGHTIVTDAAVPATCTETGLTEGSHCSVCGEVIKEQETIPATGHEWDEGKVTKEPTTTEEGEKEYTCKHCEEKKTESIAKLPSEEPKPIQKIELDKEEIQLCPGKETAISATVTPEDAENKTIEWTVSDPTIAEVSQDGVVTGLKEGTVTVTARATDESGATASSQIVVGHTIVTDAAVSATCTETGLTEGSHCSVCEEVIKAQETIPATGHEWDEGKMIKEPTTTEEGQKEYTCIHCGEKKTESIAKLPPEEPKTDSPDKTESADQTGNGNNTGAVDNKVKMESQEDNQEETVKIGTEYTTKGSNYVVAENSAGSFEVEYTGSSNKNVTSVSVPATVTINGRVYKVTSIEENAFRNCKKLKKITIGKNITEIKKNAFKNCMKLKKLIIKTKKLKLKNIKKKAFAGIGKNVVIKVPKGKAKAYRKIFRKRGLSKKVKVKQ